MGLLDIFNTVEGQQGLGLLAAAGPRADGAGFGQRLQEGLGAADAWKARQQQAAFQKMQMDNYASEIEQRKAAIAKQQGMQDMLGKLLGGSRPAQGPTNLVNDALPEGLRIGAQSSIPASGGLYGAPLETIAGIHAMGGPDLMAAWKEANVGSAIPAGSYRQLPGQQPQYFTKPESGISFNNGKISPLAGNEALADIEGQKTFAQESSKNRTSLLPLGYKTANGAIGGTIAEYLGTDKPSSQPQQSGMGMRNQDGSQLSPELQAAIAQDAQANGISNPTANFKGGKSYGFSPDVPSIMTNSGRPKLQTDQEADAQAVDKAKQTEFATQSAKTAVEKVYSSHDNAKAASDALIGLNESRKAIEGGVYSGAGAETKLNIAKGLQAFGITVDSNKVTDTDYLQSTLGQGILAKAKTLGANPTDNDARIIKQIVGSIGTDPQALNKLLDAQEAMYKRTIDNHNKMYQGAIKGGFTSPYDMTVEAPQASGASMQPKSFPMLPNATQFAGKRMKSDDGTIYKSDGKRWSKE